MDLNVKVILYDLVAVSLLATASLGLGLVTNRVRNPPLPLVYSTPEARLDVIVQEMGIAEKLPLALDAEVSLNEMKQISSDHSALILDVRSASFFQAGSIPSSLNLPHDDFKKSYGVLQRTLDPYRNKTIVVYCSGKDCPDSRMVAEALRKLGYRHLRLFRGGWAEWNGANLPKTKGCNC